MDTRSFDVAVAFAQFLLLGLWEGLGAIYFGWSPLAIVLVWLVGIWTLNIGVAIVLRTYLKLVSAVDPQFHVVPEITEDDIA